MYVLKRLIINVTFCSFVSYSSFNHICRSLDSTANRAILSFLFQEGTVCGSFKMCLSRSAERHCQHPAVPEHSNRTCQPQFHHVSNLIYFPLHARKNTSCAQFLKKIPWNLSKTHYTRRPELSKNHTQP